jgi:RNA polymerase sigma-70 factor (ECF subfamily)
MGTDVQGVVASLRAGDTQAFRTLIERLQQPIIGYLHRLVGDREVALDLAQDTFLQVYKEIGKTSAELALDAWIYRIATNYGLRYLNRKRRWSFIPFSAFGFTNFAEEDALVRSGGHDQEYALHFSSMSPNIEEQTETRMLVQQALLQLKPVDAACLQLHYGDGFNYEQIGKIVGISPEAVRKRVARGVEKFRAVYGKEVRMERSYGSSR